MVKRLSALTFLFVFLCQPLMVHAQGEIQVVPVGETIKPEKVRTRRPRKTVIKAGTTFLIELKTALSSGLTREGEKVYFVAAEDVGPSRSPGIPLGAPGRGSVTMVKKDKKAGELTVRLETIEDSQGSEVPISGSIVLKGEKGQAKAGVGEKFTATLGEKLVGRRPSKAKPEKDVLQAFVEIDGKKASVDLAKGKAKGKVKAVLEPPKGYTADDIVVDSVVLSEVNAFELEKPVPADAHKPLMKDANKNGVTDWTLYFQTWEFVKNMPRGRNTIHLSGKLKNGRPFDAVTRVQISY